MVSDLQPITTEFPQDILFLHILPRLPGKSVLRFKGVSKQWNSFLSTPMFTNMHLHCIPNDDHHTPHKLLIFSPTMPFKFRTMDCEAPEHGLTTSRNLPFKVTNDEGNVCPLTSFHGLVCVGISSRFRMQYSNLILWNPLTGDHKVLSRTNCADETVYKTYGNIFRLFYSSSDDDYKLVCVNLDRAGRCQVYVYSLKSDSWRKLNSTYELNQRCDNLYWSTSSWLNGNFYFLRFADIREDVHIADLPFYSIIRFNTKTEKFTEIPTPISRDRDGSRYLSFTVLNGNIHIIVRCDRYWRRRSSQMKLEPKMELWRMDEDEKWTQVVTYFVKKPLYDPILIHVMRNENWLMVGKDYFYKVDLEKHTKDKLCLLSEGRIDIHGGKYVDTFVSPNRYIK